MSDQASSPPASRCPVCKQPAVPQFRPFCSKRCADIDLHRWLSGRYAIPVREDEDEDGDGARGQGSENMGGEDAGGEHRR